MIEIPSIATNRLLLRAFTPQDAVPLHRILGEPDILRYFPRGQAPSMEQVERLVARQLQHWQERGYGWWAVELHGSGELIGWNGLQYLPETDETEVGYLLSRAHWGKGLAVEGGCASLDYGFDRVGLERIVAIVHPENKRSQRVAEKLGMRWVEQAAYFGMDCYLYEIDPVAFRASGEGKARILSVG
jgi:RimJ/RimL family protein N-acetyltransferase